MDVSPLLTPANASQAALDPAVLYQFKIAHGTSAAALANGMRVFVGPRADPFFFDLFQFFSFLPDRNYQTAGASPKAPFSFKFPLEEETGGLADARAHVERAMRRADAIYDTPAERRAWLHARSAELALEAGDTDAAGRAANEALAIFPDHVRALTIAARVALAHGDPAAAEAVAKRAVMVQPNPEVLGLLGDAQAARGETVDAAATRDELLAVARIGDALHVNDRLVALWEADHGVRVDHAYDIARRELGVRDDIYAEDTLAWAAARSGHWDVARRAIAKALRYGTQDPAIRRHEEAIAAHPAG
jgi:tetratricopeptide (TPR) repeat protein